MAQARKTRKPRKPDPQVVDALILQCMQGLLDSQRTGITLPTGANCARDSTRQTQAAPGSRADGSFLAGHGAAVYKRALEMLMESELAAHLGYGKYKRLGRPSEGHADTTPEIASECPSKPLEGEGTGQPRRNYRNGAYTRHVRTTCGRIDIQCPRDRNGTFAPLVLPKGVKDLTGMQEKLLNLVTRGNDPRTATRLIEDIMGERVSHEYVRMTVESFSKTLEAWQSRQLKPFYPFLFIDCVHVLFHGEKHSLRNNRRPVYVVLGIDPEGRKELVHIEMRGAGKSGQDWVDIFGSLRARGLGRLLFVSMDGVDEAAEGLKVVYPKVRTFRCIVQMIRNSCNHVSHMQRKEWCDDIKDLYSSPDLATAEEALRALADKWKDSSPAAVKFWEMHFDEFVAPLYGVTPSIRKVIYTTSAAAFAEQPASQIGAQASIAGSHG